jgi:hypothetical protein
MIQRGCGLGFAAETLEGLGVTRYILRQKFQRDEAFEARVASLINDSHAAATDFLDDMEMRNCLADK